MAYRAPFADSTIPTGGTFKDRTPPRTAFHRGTDYSYNKGAKGAIPSVCNGVVVDKDWSSIVGWWVEIRSTEGDAMYWTYCHMAGNSTLAVGDAVNSGHSVGASVGATGSAARGAHLHLAGSKIRGGGLSASVANLVDPRAYIKGRTAGTAGSGTTIPIGNEDDMPIEYKLVQTPDGTVWFCWDRLYRYGIPTATVLADYAAFIVSKGQSATIIAQGNGWSFGAPINAGGVVVQNVGAIAEAVNTALADDFAGIPTAHVTLSPEDIAALADQAGLDPEELRSTLDNVISIRFADIPTAAENAQAARDAIVRPS
jgi:hypothetical protein